MFKNYLIVSIRNIMKNKLFSTINIAGLSVGLSAVLLITLYIWDEFTFDSHLAGQPGIHKLELKTNFPGRGPRVNNVTAGAGAPGLVDQYPDMVAASARIMRSTSTLTVGDRNISETIHRGDASFFDLFSLTYAEGSAETAQPDLSTVAISTLAADKWFPGEKALGQFIELDDGNSYRVGAVFNTLPQNTHIRPNYIFPLKPSNRDLVSHSAGWWSIGFNSYVQLKPGVTAAQLEAIVPEFIDRNLEAPRPNMKMSELYGYRVLPLADIHFETAAENAGDPLLLTGFAAIAFLILSIATFNFMNMSISQTVVRAKEVAVRKVFGAGQRNIISLFLNETLLTVLISLFLAVVITELSLIWFNDFVSKLMTLETLAGGEFILGLAGLVLLVSFGAGFYPAKVLAGFRPATVLRGGRSASKNMSRLAAILVTAQFAVAIGLMIAATIIYQQINYSQSMDPGYQKENMLLVQGLGHRSLHSKQQTIKDQIGSLPGVTDVALIDQAPGGRYGWMTGISQVAGEPLDQSISIRGVSVGDNFLDAFGMELIAGRTLNSERGGDIGRAVGDETYRTESNILVNEQALRTLGLGSPADAIGKTINQDETTNTIVGVVRDYVWGSSKGTVPPVLFMIDEQSFRLLAVRFRTNDVSALTEAIDKTWAEIAPQRPVRRQFMDDRIAALYQNEQRQGELLALFAGLSVLVSCIGLYGLASFSVARRTKEIGMRKVLGASTKAVTGRILWDFSKPILIANLIAWPLTAWMMGDWLTGFTYHIDLGPTPFLGAAILALIVAAFTVGGHAVRVASANPIHALRYE